jgi:hypothetical protein
MTIQAEAADGTIHEFPDGTDDAVIDKAMKAYHTSFADKIANFNVFNVGGINKPASAPNTPAQESIIAALNNQNNRGQLYASEMMKGIPIGGNFVTQTPEMSEYEEQHPLASGALRFAGGAISTAPLSALGVGAGAGLGALGTAMGTTGALSAADTATREALDNGVENIDWGKVGLSGTIGAGAGVGGVIAGGLLGKGLGKLTDALYSRFSSQGPLSNFDRMAVQKAAQALRAAGLTDAQITGRAAELGPHGFLAEYAPEFTGQAGATAALPGPGAGVVRNAFGQRAAQTSDRIEQAMTDTMGGRLDLAAQSAAREAAQKAAAKPLYDAFRQTSIEPTDELRDLMPRLQAAGVVGSAARKMQVQGEPLFNYFFKRDPLTGQMTLDTESVPTAQLYDYLKRGLDDKVGTAYRAGEMDDARMLTGLKNELVDAVDKQTPIWKAARDSWAGPASIQTALETGQELFKRSTRVDEFAQDLKRIGAPEAEAMLQGARDSIAGMMDATSRGSTAARDLFRAQAPQQKLQMLLSKVYGPQEGARRTNDLVTNMEREYAFANSRSQTIYNSETARRLKVGATLEPPQEGFLDKLMHTYSPHVTPFNFLQLTGIPERARYGASNRYEAMRGELARILTAQGPLAQQYAQALRGYQPPSETVGPMTQRIIDYLMRSGAVTSTRPQQQ